MPLLTFPALAALCGLLFWVLYAGVETNTLRAAVIKTLSTACLALFGALIGAPGWVVLGLGLGAAGDYALARPGDRAFLAGMVAFALGHLAYVVEFVDRIHGLPTSVPALFWLVVAAMVILVALTAVWIAPKAGTLKWPVRGYAVVIACMALSATLLPHSAGRVTMQIGVASFVASDLILAFRMFVLKDANVRLWAGRALWPLYWGGQALILVGSFA